MAEEISDANIRSEALNYIERARKRWKGEKVAGDYDWDSGWEIVQKMAKALGIDISNESSPLVRGLRLAVKDNSPVSSLAANTS